MKRERERKCEEGNGSNVQCKGRVVVLTGRKRSCSLYSPTSWSVIGAGSGASWVDSGAALEPSLRGAIFGVYSDDITALTRPLN